MIQLRTLGSLDLRVQDGRELRSLLAQPRRLALLLYLALSDADFHRRDSLLALFWPESTEEAARASLRTALSVVRRSLGEGVLVKRGNEEVGIAPERLRCDVTAFEAALRAGALEQALELYRGDLLAGFYIDGSPEFERWLDAERGRLSERAAAAARALAERAEEEGDTSGAMRWARRAAALAPDDEGALRRLIELLDRVGDRVGALRAYEEFAGRLAAEFEVEPSPETQALVQAVRARADATVLPAAPGEVIEEPAIPAVDSVAPAAPASGAGPGIADRSAARPARTTAPLPLAVRLLGAGAVAILVLAVSSLIVAPGAGAPLVPERVLVLPFENRTGDPELDVLGAMAADWITQGLAETGLVEVVTSTTMLATWDYMAVETERPHGARLYRQLAEETRAGTLVSGSFYRDADSIRYQARVTDANDGRVLRSMDPVAGPAGAPLEAVGELRTRVMGVLAAHFDPRLTLTTASASRPPTFEAYRAYLEGTEHFIRGQQAEAIPHYLTASALDPDFAQARIFAAICLHNVGDPVRADSVARTLNGQRDRLSPFDRHLLDWVLAWIQGDRVGALAAIRSATEVVPGSEWLYVRSLSALDANRPAEGVESLLKLDPERGFMRGFVAYWSDLAASLHMLGEHRRELRAAQQARRQYPQDIIALRAEVRALAALGRVPEVERRLEESLILPMKYGIDPGAMIRIAASELRAHGHSTAAAEVIDGAIAWYRHRPSEEQRGIGNRAGLGQALYLAERWEEARAVFAELATEQPANLDHLGHLGVLAARTGNHAEARRIDALLAGTDRAFLHGTHTYWRARIAAATGDRERAVQLLRESFAQGRAFEPTLHTEMDFEPLRDHPAFRELLRPKG